MIKYSLPLLGVVAMALGCEPLERPSGWDEGINCAAEDEIEFQLAEPTAADQPPYFGLAWEASLATAGSPTPDGSFFCFADFSLNGYPTEAPWPSTGGCPVPMMEPINDGAGFCQQGTAAGTRHRAALHLQAGNHIYWGGQWGNWNMRGGATKATFPSAADPTVELPADGIAFWARKDVGSDAQILVQLEDENVNSNGKDANGNPSCTLAADGTSQQQQAAGNSAAAVDPNVQTSNSSAASVDDPSACGNRWNAILTLTDEWELHLLPFDSFYQALSPNRESESLNPNFIFQVAFAYGTGQTIGMWFDEMYLYRNK